MELHSCNRIENAQGAKQGVKKTCIRKVGKLKRRRRFDGMGEAQPIPIDLFQF